MSNGYSVEAILKATGVDAFVNAFKKAGKQIDEFKKNAEQIGDSMKTAGDGLQKFGSGLTKGITLPVAAAVGASIKSFADLEQAVGGIETMFEKTAGTVIKNSETAYKRAGVSGVDYMENVTSFSASLLQGLGGDTVKAAELADTAMVDMSDNANKFGTDIGSIQDAYQGFAKGNFTMLDNLKLGRRKSKAQYKPREFRGTLVA